MHTTTEIAVTITIWGMLAVGCFFALRAAWRRRRGTRNDIRLKI